MGRWFGKRGSRIKGAQQGRDDRTRPMLKEHALSLLQRGQIGEANAQLEALAAESPKDAHVFELLGSARMSGGDVAGALDAFERAWQLSRDPHLWPLLAELYLHRNMNAHAINAWRQAQRADVALSESLRQALAECDREVATLVETLGRPRAKVLEGLHELERGQRFIEAQEPEKAIEAARRAARMLGDWPPPHNNLSYGLFMVGRVKEAVVEARRVIAAHPENVHALANLVRFFAWSGNRNEASSYWTRLKALSPQEPLDRMKQIEAAAILEDDEMVYQSAQALSSREAPEDEVSRYVQRHLAIAEANLGRRKAALQRLRKVAGLDDAYAGSILAALEAGRSSLGFKHRFSYHPSVTLLPPPVARALQEMTDETTPESGERARRMFSKMAPRFPQLVVMAEKQIWDEGLVQVGVELLGMLATPEAHAALRRFALSQAGSDEERMAALQALSESGGAELDEHFRFWSQGEWREIQLRTYTLSEESDRAYAPDVADLLNRGVAAMREGRADEAERLLRRAITLDPTAQEGYNNLGSLYARRGDHEAARAMYRKAIEVAPAYAYPRLNLALYLLNEDDIAGAKAMLEPLAGATHFQPREFAFYLYLQARIAIEEEQFEAAQRALDSSLALDPDFQPAVDLSEWLKRRAAIEQLQSGWQLFMERQQERNQATRARQQAKLTSLAPALDDVLRLFSAEVLKAMGRAIAPGHAWSGLRKAKVLERLEDLLRDGATIHHIVIEALTGGERAALAAVMARGGAMPRAEFVAAYGDDNEESPFWQYHLPTSILGRLRLHLLLAEATVEGAVHVAVPAELRTAVAEALP